MTAPGRSHHVVQIFAVVALEAPVLHYSAQSVFDHYVVGVNESVHVGMKTLGNVYLLIIKSDLNVVLGI